jgi:predicted DNA-binding transcriptional regulator AlpA
MAQRQLLPHNLPPRGLSRTEAAAYVGVSATLFDRMIAEQKMPRPKRYGARTFWDLRKIDIAFDALPDENDRDDVWSRPAV